MYVKCFHNKSQKLSKTDYVALQILSVGLKMAISRIFRMISFDLYTEYLRLYYVPKWRFLVPLFLF